MPTKTKKATGKRFVSPWPKDARVRTSSINLSFIDKNGEHRAQDICTIHWDSISDKEAVELAERMRQTAFDYINEQRSKPKSSKK